MQVCTSLQTDNHASTPPLCFLQAGCPSCRPTNSIKALKAKHQLVATITTTITKSKSNTKTILKLNQNTENYIKTVTKTMLKLKRFSKFDASCQVSKYLCKAEDSSLSTAHLSDPLRFWAHHENIMTNCH